LNVPLYEGGQVNSKTREAAHRHDEALAALRQVQRAVHRQAREAYLGVLADISRVRALQQAVRSSEAAVNAVNAGIAAGSRTHLDGVLAEREGYRARRDLSRARYDYLLDTLRLKRAVGILVGEDLVRLNSWLAARR
jgi:outer membrane protein